MGKATLILVTIAALGFGLLVGFSLVDDESEDSSAEVATATMIISTGGAPAFRYISPEDDDVKAHDTESGEPFARGENFAANDQEWRTESLVIDLAGDSRVEYKAFMAQGDTLIFNWQVEGEDVYYDFHAHDAAFGEEFYTRYDEGTATHQSGSIIAAYGGQHGWYWQNLEPDDVQLTLEVAGFYDKIMEMDLGDQ